MIRRLFLILAMHLSGPFASEAHAEKRKREHRSPSASLGNFLRPGETVPPYRPSFERSMGDLVPTLAAPAAAAEEAFANAERGWDSLRRQFLDAPAHNDRLQVLYARERIVVLSPCHSRSEVDDDPDSVHFASTPGLALVAAGQIGGLIETPKLIEAAVAPGMGRTEAWARLRETFRRGTGAVTLPRAPSGRIAFGPLERFVPEGEGRVTQETSAELRGTPTDLFLRYVSVERRTDEKTGRIRVKRTERYCH